MERFIGCVAAVVGLFFLASNTAAAETGVIAWFSMQKVSCADKNTMIQQAASDAQGGSDGLVLEGCELLPARTVVLMDVKNSILVPDCDAVYVYRIHRIRHRHVLWGHYRYIAIRTGVSPDPN